VFPTDKNIQKSDKLHLKADPDPNDLEAALPQYAHLVGTEPTTVGPGMAFTPDQKDAIYQANIAHYKRKGQIISDHDKRTVLHRVNPDITPDVDHKTPVSLGGSNYYFNAKVMSTRSNIRKSGVKGGNVDRWYDWKAQQMTLKAFIDHVRSGNWNPPDESSSESGGSREETGSSSESEGIPQSEPTRVQPRRTSKIIKSPFITKRKRLSSSSEE
jgi:hypothetical protein